MTSLEDNYDLRSRKRTCLAGTEVPAEVKKKPPSRPKKTKSSLKTDTTPQVSQYSHAGLTPEKKTRGKKKKPAHQQPEVDPAICSPNQHLSQSLTSSEPPTVPLKSTACLKKSPKRSQKGRNKTSKKGSNSGANVEPSDKLESNPNVTNCVKSPQTKAKVKPARAIKTQTKTKTSAAPHTLSPSPSLSLSPHQDVPTSPTGSDPVCRQSTPTSTRHRPAAALSSTPLSTRSFSQKHLDTTETSDPQSTATNGHQEIELSPIKKSQSDVPPKKRGRPRKPKPPDKPTAQPKNKKEQRVSDAPLITQRRKRGGAKKAEPQNQPANRVRPRFELHESEVHDSELQKPELDVSSDLSIELSLQEKSEIMNHSSLQEEEEEEDEEELPSFLQQTSLKPSSIREGLCVWCKLRKYPFWPAMVKSVNHKNKKASIVFIDGLLFDKKRIRKSFTVSLRTLKPFDCEESDQFVVVAKEKYGDYITWSLELISDYRIRIGCGSFAGSFFEYFSDDISYPVRRRHPESSFELGFPSQQLLSEERDSEGEPVEELEEEQNQQLDEVHCKKVLPDRAQAARNRANERLVDFIVRKRGAEKRLMKVISGQESSKWLQALQSCSRSVVEVYLEDEGQVDKVYRYLEKLCEVAAKTNTGLENMDRIQFILDVLLPEAIIYAIAGVDHVPLDKAEEKYRRGPCHSYRERQEFDMMIEQQMKLKAIRPRSSS